MSQKKSACLFKLRVDFIYGNTDWLFVSWEPSQWPSLSPTNYFPEVMTISGSCNSIVNGVWHRNFSSTPWDGNPYYYKEDDDSVILYDETACYDEIQTDCVTSICSMIHIFVICPHKLNIGLRGVPKVRRQYKIVLPAELCFFLPTCIHWGI